MADVTAQAPAPMEGIHHEVRQEKKPWRFELNFAMLSPQPSYDPCTTKSDIETSASRAILTAVQYGSGATAALVVHGHPNSCARTTHTLSSVLSALRALVSPLPLHTPRSKKRDLKHPLQQSLHAKASSPPPASLNKRLHRFACNAHVHASLSVGFGGVRRADESFETVSVDRIYIYMAMGRLRPRDGLISMKDLQVCFVCKRNEASRRLCLPWRTTSLAHTRWVCPTVDTAAFASRCTSFNVLCRAVGWACFLERELRPPSLACERK